MSTIEPQGTTRRDVLKASAAAAFTTMIFPKMMRGANDFAIAILLSQSLKCSCYSCKIEVLAQAFAA